MQLRKQQVIQSVQKNPKILFDYLNLDEIKENSKYINGTCPIHKGDNQNAFVYYKDTANWMCFTNSCHGNKNSGNIIEFLSKLKNIDEEKSLEIIEKLYGLNNVFDKNTSDKIKFTAINLRLKKDNKPIKILEDSVLENFVSKKYDYYLKRGYEKETLDYFDVKFCDNPNDKYFNRMIVPIHDKDGNLVSWTARWSGNHKEDNVPKFLHHSFPKTKVLYNWHRAEKFFKCGYVFVVESPGAVWGLYQIGVYNVVAVLGKTLSNEQAKLIIRHPNINTVILCFDSDLAGQSGMSDKCQTIKNLKDKVNIQRIFLSKDSDLDNISKEQFEMYFLQRR